MTQADIGLIGLAVMGQNLVLNLERNGYCVAVYNRTTAVTDEFVAAHPGKQLLATRTMAEFVASLARPRRILIMVKAGSPVDAVIEQLAPLLEPGDLIMDGGNSHFPDTERRSRDLPARGLQFMGVGVSGGEEGALWGPSIMPGGSPDAWNLVAPMLQAIAAKAPEDGKPCVVYLGPRSAGHYVKMVHNGIEYGDMQLIAEAYSILHGALGLEASELAAIFTEWNQGELDSYLIEITAQIFRRIDDLTGKPLVDLVLDTAQQKGTGKWTSQDSFNIAAPIPDHQQCGGGAHHVRHEAGARGRGRSAARAGGALQRRPPAVDRQRAPGALRQQDQRLRPGHGHAAHRQPGVRL
jgi:6-phosphogluconate dehydrogenase